jgi:hypothetical protein
MEPHIRGRSVRAIELRYVLTWYLHEHGPLTVAQLARALEGDALTIWGRPSKAISDALRWEVGRGRVVRLGRGRYGPGRIPRATAHRIRRRVEAIRAGELTSPWAY